MGRRGSNTANSGSALHTLNLAMCTGLGDGLGLRELLRGSAASLRDLNLSWTGLTQAAVDRLAGCMPPRLSKVCLIWCRISRYRIMQRELCLKRGCVNSLPLSMDRRNPDCST